MDTSPHDPNTPTLPDSGVFSSSSSGDLVLGYPETEPPAIDMGSMPSSVGAKPSGKSGVKPKSSLAENPAAPTRTGPPLPKRPKGRLFVGSVFILTLAGLGFSIFHSSLRYTAYGEVVGRTIELAVPWPGIVQSLHVREGDLVESGDLVAKIDSLQMRQKIEEIDDSLRLERARLASELAMLRWEAEKIRDTRKLTLSEFYDKWSELLWEQSRMADLRVQVERIEPIYRQGAASEERLESLRFQYAGQQKRVEQLTEAVRALKHRSDESPIELALEDRVQPTLARIENLQAELLRTRETIRQGEIRAPAAGRIVRTHRFAGEYADQMTPIAELFVEGSTELVIYLPQSAAKDYPVGRDVALHVNPIKVTVQCQVERVAMKMQKAPESLQRYYRTGQSLLPVFLRIKDFESVPGCLALGSEVRLPRSENLSALSQWRDWWIGESKTDGDHETDGGQAPNPLRPAQTAPRVRTARGQHPPTKSAEIEMSGRDAPAAGWIQLP